MIDQMVSEGLIYFVNQEYRSGWTITAKGIRVYRESTQD